MQGPTARACLSTLFSIFLKKIIKSWFIYSKSNNFLYLSFIHSRFPPTRFLPTSGPLYERQLLVCLYRADVPANIVSPIIGLLVLDRCLGYYRSTNLRFIKTRPTLSLSFIHQPSIFNIGALVEPSFIDQSLLSQCWTDNQRSLDQPIFNFLKLRWIPILFKF